MDLSARENVSNAREIFRTRGKPAVVFLKMVQIIIRIVALFDSPKGRALETATKFRLRNFELF